MGPRIPSGRRTADSRAPRDAPGDGTDPYGAVPARREPDHPGSATRGEARVAEEDGAPDARPVEQGGSQEGGAQQGGAKGLGLSVPQVAASTAAAVSGAFAASGLGVYGTIIGAGVISVVATVGGALYQRLFDKTGEQLRDATRTRPRPAAAAPGYANPPGTTDAAHPVPGAERAEPGTGPPDPGLPEAPGESPAEPGYTAATEYGVPRRRRLLRRRAVMAVAVFLLAMAAVTGIELATGSSVPQTSVGDLFSRETGGGPSDPEGERSEDPAGDGGDPAEGEDDDGDRDTPATPGPDEGEQGEPGEGEGTPGQESGGVVPDTSDPPRPSETPGGNGGPTDPAPGGTSEPTPTAPEETGDETGEPADRAPANAPDGGTVPEE